MEVDTERLAATIDVFWPTQTFVPCPECQNLCSLKDSKHRIWRHLDTMQFKSFLRCEVPRVDCPDQEVLQIFLPWSDPKSRFTLMFENVAAVAMDMWEPFRTIVEKVLPKADIVHDRYHFTSYLTRAVDSVRKSEHRDLMQRGIEVLKGTKYLWLPTVG